MARKRTDPRPRRQQPRTDEQIQREAARWHTWLDLHNDDDAKRGQFAKWLSADTRHQYAYFRVKAAWELADLASGASKESAPRRKSRR